MNSSTIHRQYTIVRVTLYYVLAVLYCVKFERVLLIIGAVGVELSVSLLTFRP